MIVLFLWFGMCVCFKFRIECDYNQPFRIVCNEQPHMCYSRIFEAKMDGIRSSINTVKFVGCKKSTDFDANILEHFSGVRILDISSQSLNTIPALKIRHLRSFIASHNWLNKLPTEMFDKNVHLAEIDFSYNKLSELHATSFKSVLNLSKLNFSHNQIFYVNNEAFSQLGQLKILDLSFNKIGTIGHGIFEHNPKLEMVRLEMNSMYRFNESVLELAVNSVTLSISCENVKELDLTSMSSSFKIELDGFENVVNFSLSKGNSISCRRDDFRHMYYFNVSGNHLRHLHEFIKFLESPLETIDLSENFLGFVDNSTFNRFEHVRFLNLSHTNLSFIAADAFSRLEKLKIIDLSRNLLMQIDFGSMVFENLRTLHLEFNRLNEINSVNPTNFPSLMTLDIVANNFSCQYLAKWEYLNIFGQWENLTVTKCQSDNEEICCYDEDTDETTTTEMIDEIFGTKRPTTESYVFDDNLTTDTDSKDTDHSKIVEISDMTYETTLGEYVSETQESTSASEFTSSLASSEHFFSEKVSSSDFEQTTKSSANETPSADFWLQLQIIQSILVVFCIFLILVKAIQRIIDSEKGKQMSVNDCDKEQDEFQTIELDSCEFGY